MSKIPKIPLLVIVGPTASGKSALAVSIAQKLGGEIVSADSRQVYRGLNVGAGKITRPEMKGIRHHLLDVADPRKKFTVVKYVALAEKTIADIHARGKLPIICGGTGFYIQALVDGIILPEVGANEPLRKKLSKKTAAELFTALKKLDPRRAAQMKKTSDHLNPRRLIRALEVATALGAVPILKKQLAKYDAQWIGISINSAELKKKIHARLISRMKHGMVAEAKRLHARGLSWRRMEELGLEYRYLALYLQGKTTREAMIEKLNTEIGRYAKRQMTWFKRDSRINWSPVKA